VSPGERVEVGGPYFEDFERGQIFDAPALTLNTGHAAVHQAIVGDRLPLPLDSQLARSVTGHDAPLVHPNLVCDVAIGQTTGPTQRVLGNLFYRGLVLLRPVFIGDTLRTRTKVIALKQNRTRSGAAATGLVALRMRTEDQNGRAVLDFFRCPMIPLRDPSVRTGHADRFDEIPRDLEMNRVRDAVPSDWRYDVLRERYSEQDVPERGIVYEVEGRETVTSAPELARLTLNVAMTHRDATAGPHGHRLVYGGQTIGIAAAHASHAVPRLVTIIAWRSCEHLGPVFEGDILSTELTIGETHELDRSDAVLVDMRAVVRSDRAPAAQGREVLDWRFLGLVV
jgi:2-methylfumaryl-CoA hydratase